MSSPEATLKFRFSLCRNFHAMTHLEKRITGVESHRRVLEDGYGSNSESALYIYEIL